MVLTLYTPPNLNELIVDFTEDVKNAHNTNIFNMFCQRIESSDNFMIGFFDMTGNEIPSHWISDEEQAYAQKYIAQAVCREWERFSAEPWKWTEAQADEGDRSYDNWKDLQLERTGSDE